MQSVSSARVETGSRKPVKPALYYVLSHEQFTVPQLVDQGAAAESAGFQGIWTSDHFQPWQPNQGHSGFAWATLAAITQRTSRIAFGTGVTCPTFRFLPAIVAQAWASLSQLAPGRPYLGLGTGEKLNEGAAGGGWGTYEERSSRLIEAVGIIRALWKGDNVNLNGRFWKVQGRLYDPPVSGIPIYIAAGGPKSGRLAGRYGDGLIIGARSLNNTELRSAWEEGVRESGRNPASQSILVEHWAVVGGDAEARSAAENWRFSPRVWEKGFFDNIDPSDIEARAKAEVPLETVYKNWTVSTDPEDHLRAILHEGELGATHVAVHVPMPNQTDIIRFFGEKVLPMMNGG